MAYRSAGTKLKSAEKRCDISYILSYTRKLGTVSSSYPLGGGDRSRTNLEHREMEHLMDISTCSPQTLINEKIWVGTFSLKGYNGGSYERDAQLSQDVFSMPRGG